MKGPVDIPQVVAGAWPQERRFFRPPIIDLLGIDVVILRGVRINAYDHRRASALEESHDAEALLHFEHSPVRCGRKSGAQKAHAEVVVLITADASSRK